MRKTILLVFIIILFCLFFSYYPAFTKLQKIETTHFIIYYEKSIEHFIDSEYLKFMEDSYNFLSNLFDNSFKNKIYVYLSSREKLANGFNMPVGQSTIYIITTPPELSSSIGFMDEWFKLVFYHELTHQFSLTLKSKLAEFLSYLFGNIFLSSYFNNPFYMIEGVTTSFEGREFELGRTYSPSIKQYIIQSIIDNNFKSPYELEAGYNEYPYRSAGYWYGGFFSKFLQENYGMQFYIKLWKTTASMPFELAIKKVYEKELLELWEEFYNWIKPQFEVYINYNSCIKEFKNHLLSNGRLAKIKDKTYYFYYDATLKSIYRYDIENKKNEPVIKNILSFYSFEINEVKSLLLLQYLDFNNPNYPIKNKIYNIEKKKFENSIIEKFDYIREISFFNDGFIGIDLSRSYTDLVILNLDGSKEIIIYGDKKFYISKPVQLNSKTILFIGSINGKRNLYTYDIFDKTLKRLKLNANYIYSFNVYDNRIYFVYNDDYTLSKLGIIDNQNEIHLEKNFSGGFRDPFYFDGSIYYIGSFSNKSLLLYLNLDINSIIEGTNIYKDEENLKALKIMKREKDEIIQIIDKSVKFDDNNNINNKNSEEKQNSSNVSTSEEYILNKSSSVYPLNENLIPDFWIPAPSFYFSQYLNSTDIFFNGFGANILWMEPVSNSITSAGIYLASFDPVKVSFDFMINLNYFYPFTIRFLAASYWMDNLSLENESLQYLFLTCIDFFYEYTNILGNNSSIFNIGIFYRNYQNRFFSIYFYNEYYSYLFDSPNLPFSIKNLLYFSNINFANDYAIKYEIETSILIRFLNIEIKDNLSISKDKNLTSYPINDYFDSSLYEPLYEIDFQYPNINCNFINVAQIEATIFETQNMGILNFIFPSSVSILGLYLGYKYYFISDLNYQNFNYDNTISAQIIYGTLSISIIGKVIDIGFTVSYSIEFNELYYYFYYIIGNPYSLF